MHVIWFQVHTVVEEFSQSGLPVGTIVLVASVTFAVVLLAEWIHYRRIMALRPLIFGPHRYPLIWTQTALWTRPAAAAAVAAALLTLMLVRPEVRRPGEGSVVPFEKLKHIIMVLDVSPSMRLVDAGPHGDMSRMARAREVMESWFQRIPMNEFRITVVATYTRALPVVEDTNDIGVVRNILSDLPMHFAFRSGETDLFSGIAAAADAARGNRPRSTVVVLVTDGDTVPATGMPTMPAAVSDVVIVGIGNPREGSFINGRNSRQDVATLRQVAARLRGTYHDANEHHLRSELITRITHAMNDEISDSWSTRDWALIILTVAVTWLSVLPILLHYVGSFWRPGVHATPVARQAAATGERRRVDAVR